MFAIQQAIIHHPVTEARSRSMLSALTTADVLAIADAAAARTRDDEAMTEYLRPEAQGGVLHAFTPAELAKERLAQAQSGKASTGGDAAGPEIMAGLDPALARGHGRKCQYQLGRA